MEKKNTSGLAIASLVIGIIAFVTSWMPFFNTMSFFMGVVGLVLAIIGTIKSTKKAMGIVSIILCVLAMVFTMATQNIYSNAVDEAFDDATESLNDMSGENTDKVLADYADVQLGELQVSEDEYGIVNSKLDVTVTNKSDEKKTFNLTIEAVDENGNRIMDDYVYANDLAAGQSATYQVFQYIESEKLEQMKSATFNIADASMY